MYTSTLVSRSDNVDCLSETILSEIVEAHPAYPCETVPMITVPRAAKKVEKAEKKPSRSSRRHREPRPSMPVMVMPVSRSDVQTIQTRAPAKAKHRALAAVVGFVLAAVGCTLAMHVAHAAGIETPVVAR